MQVLEAIFNPSVDLEPWVHDLVNQWQLSELGGDLHGPQQREEDDMGPIASLFLRNLIRLPAIVRDPETHLSQAISYYLLATRNLKTLQHHINRLSRVLSSKVTTHITNPPLQLRLLVVYQTAYGILLALTILLNAILRAFDDFNPTVIGEASYLPEQVITLAEQVSAYRPLGASYMPLALMVAWAATTIPEQRQKLGMYLVEWQGDFGADYIAGALWMERMLEALRLRQTWPGCEFVV
jgi:hypothetical protein